jgi:hypothetical protein
MNMADSKQFGEAGMKISGMLDFKKVLQSVVVRFTSQI